MKTGWWSIKMERKKDITFLIFDVVPQLAWGSCLYDIWHTISRRPRKRWQRIPQLEISHDHGHHCGCRNCLIFVSHEHSLAPEHASIQTYHLSLFDRLICNYADHTLIKHHLAENKLLSNHKDSEHDALYTIMNILLQTENKQARLDYIDLSLKMLSKSPIGYMLKDPILFWILFKLFYYDHFQSWDNTKAGLSMWNIVTWYPVIAGVSMILHRCYLSLFHYQDVRHVMEKISIMLNFLAAPVPFQNVSNNVPSKDLPMTFYNKYKWLENEFQEPIPTEAQPNLRQALLWRLDWPRCGTLSTQGEGHIQDLTSILQSVRRAKDVNMIWARGLLDKGNHIC